MASNSTCVTPYTTPWYPQQKPMSLTDCEFSKCARKIIAASRSCFTQYLLVPASDVTQITRHFETCSQTLERVRAISTTSSHYTVDLEIHSSTGKATYYFGQFLTPKATEKNIKDFLAKEEVREKF